MRETSDRDVAFERVAARLKLTGRSRETGRRYFLGEAAKEICRVIRIPEGTLKRDLVWLHGRLGTSDRAELVHRIYEMGGRSGR